MQLRRLVFLVAISIANVWSIAADQTGAERHQKVVAVQIVKPGEKGSDGIGNVQVTYADGTKDMWTTKGNCSRAKAAPDGTVGWTVHGELARVNSQESMRPNPELVICRQGKVLARIQAALPFIEEWKFLEGGSYVVMRCRGAHGPANIELHDTASGKLINTVKAYEEKLPAWARSLKDE
jgi:hypothetical protein